MEQNDQTRGDRNEIIVHDEPTIYGGEQPATPLTFTEAEQHNAYGLLLELHDHATTVLINAEHLQARDHHLGELALSAAVISWWNRWQPLSMHRAFQAGADIAQVAAATGTTEAEAYARWSTWADCQSKLVIAGKPCLDPAEVQAIRARLAA